MNMYPNCEGPHITIRTLTFNKAYMRELVVSDEMRSAMIEFNNKHKSLNEMLVVYQHGTVILIQQSIISDARSKVLKEIMEGINPLIVDDDVILQLHKPAWFADVSRCYNCNEITPTVFAGAGGEHIICTPCALFLSMCYQFSTLNIYMHRPTCKYDHVFLLDERGCLSKIVIQILQLDDLKRDLHSHRYSHYRYLTTLISKFYIYMQAIRKMIQSTSATTLPLEVQYCIVDLAMVSMKVI